MYVQNLIREFEIVRMKDNEYMKEFIHHVRLEYQNSRENFNLSSNKD